MRYGIIVLFGLPRQQNIKAVSSINSLHRCQLSLLLIYVTLIKVAIIMDSGLIIKRFIQADF